MRAPPRHPVPDGHRLDGHVGRTKVVQLKVSSPALAQGQRGTTRLISLSPERVAELGAVSTRRASLLAPGQVCAVPVGQAGVHRARRVASEHPQSRDDAEHCAAAARGKGQPGPGER